MDREPVAVSLITGFLGAGKTTLLNRILKDPAVTNTAVIINEFGDVSVDHLLVEQSSDGIIELADGCVCCTVRGELVDTIADLIDQAQTGRIAALDRIVIETTGLADPVPVLQTLMGHPVLASELRLSGVIAIVDAVNGQGTIAAHDEAQRQIAVADRIVLTKTDLPQADSAATITALRDLNKSAPLLDSADKRVETISLLECGLYNPESKSADVARWLGEAASHDHHGHNHSHHHAGISSFSLVHDRPVDLAAVEMFLDLVRSTQGEKLLRMKGVVELAEDPDHPLVLHAVQKLMHPPARLQNWPDNQPRGTRLVFITSGMDESYVRKLFAAFTNSPAVDAPDRAALENNPLAISGFTA